MHRCGFFSQFHVQVPVLLVFIFQLSFTGMEKERKFVFGVISAATIFSHCQFYGTCSFSVGQVILEKCLAFCMFGCLCTGTYLPRISQICKLDDT